MRTLHVGGEAIQSSMRLDDPFALALDYTRAMMAFLLFHPEPRRALMLGLGGGSLPKYFYKHLRKTSIKVVELDPRVLAVCRAQFGLPADDARLEVEIGDGAQALSPECCDVLVVDAYQDEEHVQELASQAFYDAAFLALASPGVMVVNFMDDDRLFDTYLRRIEASFGGAAAAMKALYDPNIAVFALKGLPSRMAWEDLRLRAARLESLLGLPFTRYLSRLRGMNPCTSTELILQPDPAPGPRRDAAR
ncbi:MAG: fused MFS/spermidine synthase [Betaproteobacteria bacterium]|nr:fused MFS/spermidine synthase [Betaproteobacteria bacterium]